MTGLWFREFVMCILTVLVLTLTPVKTECAQTSRIHIETVCGINPNPPTRPHFRVSSVGLYRNLSETLTWEHFLSEVPSPPPKKMCAVQKKVLLFCYHYSKFEKWSKTSNEILTVKIKETDLPEDEMLCWKIINENVCGSYLLPDILITSLCLILISFINKNTYFHSFQHPFFFIQNVTLRIFKYN